MGPTSEIVVVVGEDNYYQAALVLVPVEQRQPTPGRAQFFLVELIKEYRSLTVET